MYKVFFSIMRLASPGIARGFKQPLPPVTPPRHHRSNAFTLIEVVIALGIATFAMLPILALMPVGLQTLQNSSNDTVTAGIAQQIRGELQQVSFNPQTSGTPTALTMSNLCGTLDGQYLPASSQPPGFIYYYSLDGVQLNVTNPLSTAPVPAGTYFSAVFTRQTATMPGTTGTYDGANAAEMVTVYLSYPHGAPQANQQKIVFSLLAAKQNSD